MASHRWAFLPGLQLGVVIGQVGVTRFGVIISPRQGAGTITKGEGTRMSAIGRRRFLTSGVAFGAAWLVSSSAGDGERFDLLIHGGEVLDPSQRLRGRRDVGIRWGRIAGLEAQIAPERALQTIDATGKIVVPGLVDLHAHVFPMGSALGLPADELVPF